MPINYLGHVISATGIGSQKLSFRTDCLNTLNDFQKLLGNINWVRPFLKLTTGELSPLFKILQGNADPQSPRSLTSEARTALQLVEQKIFEAKVQQISYHQEWDLLILNTAYTPTGCLWQDGILEWIHLPHVQHKMLASYPYRCSLIIQKGRVRSRKLFGQEMHNIIVPYSKIQFEALLMNDDDWVIALQGYAGQIKYHYPKYPLLEVLKETAIIFPTNYSYEPLSQVLNIFTDGSSNGRVVVYVPGHEPLVQESAGKSQQAEINAVIIAFSTYLEPFNLYTDSKYVVSLFPAIETALLSGKSQILPLLQKLQLLLHQRTSPFFIGHVRGHSNLPGPISWGNQQADNLTHSILLPIAEAQRAHALHHQNASALRYMYKITREQARQIIKDCGHCPPLNHVQKMGVNPRGLKPQALWQMDVTHVPEFGKLAYVHVTVDTCSHLLFASARTGEAVKDVIQHLLQCFLFMGKPLKIKTDNAPAYTSRSLSTFLLTWGITHSTGIPHNPQGQAIIERSHQLLKNQICRLRAAHSYFTPHQILTHALFVLNHINVDDQGLSAASRHWGGFTVLSYAPGTLERSPDRNMEGA